MKKVLAFLSIFLCMFFITNVNACGEIKTIRVSNGTVTKTSWITYDVRIKENVTKVKIEATANGDWENGYGPREVSTNKSVELHVNGEKCGTGINTYKINFIKETTTPTTNAPVAQPTTSTTTTTTTKKVEEPSNEGIDNTQAPQNDVVNENDTKMHLQNLSITGYEINFEPDIYTYSITVEKDVSSIEIVPTLENETDTYTISETAQNLTKASNLVEIVVTDANGNSSTYELTVLKNGISDNNYLSSILVSGYTLNFDPSITTYNITIKNEESLNITVVTEDNEASYVILGNSNLTDGSTITIRVASASNEIRDYVINISKEQSILDLLKDYWQFVAIGFLVLILIIILIINSISKKKRNKKVSVPETIEAPKETVGLTANNFTQMNNVTAQPTEPTIEPVIPTGNSQIQFMQPTDIETPKQEEQTETTEVFKL